MKKPAQHLIAEVTRKRAKAELTIGIDLGDVWSHYCTLNQEGEVVDRGRFRTTAEAINVRPISMISFGCHIAALAVFVPICTRLGQNACLRCTTCVTRQSIYRKHLKCFDAISTPCQRTLSRSSGNINDRTLSFPITNPSVSMPLGYHRRPNLLRRQKTSRAVAVYQRVIELDIRAAPRHELCAADRSEDSPCPRLTLLRADHFRG